MGDMKILLSIGLIAILTFLGTKNVMQYNAEQTKIQQSQDSIRDRYEKKIPSNKLTQQFMFRTSDGVAYSATIEIEALNQTQKETEVILLYLVQQIQTMSRNNCYDFRNNKTLIYQEFIKNNTHYPINSIKIN